MKKSFAVAVFTALSTLMAANPSAGAVPAPQKSTRYKNDEQNIALRACTLDGKTARALFGVIGTPADMDEFRKHMTEFWIDVTSRHSAKELTTEAQTFKDDFNTQASAIAEKLNLTLTELDQKAIKYYSRAIRIKGPVTIVQETCAP